MEKSKNGIEKILPESGFLFKFFGMDCVNI